MDNASDEGDVVFEKENIERWSLPKDSCANVENDASKSFVEKVLFLACPR
jgi:hypothetical protein